MYGYDFYYIFIIIMSTYYQIIRKVRIKKKKLSRTKVLGKCPQKRGICVRVYTRKPKKPHSAIRKVAKVFLPSRKRHVIACIPGQGHNLSIHSVVLIRGGRVRDIPGVHCKLMRNKYDFTAEEPFIRKRRRSKYGLKSLKKI